MMHFDIEKFWRKLKQLSLGTGTLATRAGVRPDDVQKLIALGETTEEIGAKIVDVLTTDVLAYVEEPEERTEIIDKVPIEPIDISLSISKIKAKIEDGVWSAKKVLEQEQAQEMPRTTLLAWLEEELAPYDTEETT